MAAAHVKAAKKLTRVKTQSLPGKLCWRRRSLIGSAERLEELFLFILSRAVVLSSAAVIPSLIYFAKKGKADLVISTRYYR